MRQLCSMDFTTMEKKCAITATHHRLLIYISGQNARHLYNLKINDINNKTDLLLVNIPTIMSLLSGEREFSMQDEGDINPCSPPPSSLSPWHRLTNGPICKQ